jgi:hypothetical protein
MGKYTTCVFAHFTFFIQNTEGSSNYCFNIILLPKSTASRNSLIQFQSRLSKLEADKHSGVLEPTAYTAQYNILVRDYLNFLDDTD